MEIWKQVEGFEWLEVSNLGRVRTLDSARHCERNGKPQIQHKRGKVMSPWIGDTGYVYVAPKIGERRKKLLVHRLVAKAFVTGRFPEATVNHIDGVKTNNASRNLEWVTKSRNTELQWETGLVDLRGKNNKLTPKQVIAIRASNKSHASLARKYAVSVPAIILIRQRKRWAWL